MKIAVFSSAFNKPSKESITLAQGIGEYLAVNKVVVLTGGCIGLPSVVAKSAYENGSETVAYYPDVSKKELIKNQKIHNNDLSGIYTEKKFYEGFTHRSIEMIKEADAAIVFNGRLGTLSEFTVSVEEGLPTGVIEGSGGVSNEIRRLCTLVDRDLEKDNIIILEDYKGIIDKLIENQNQKDLNK
jgi:predicted Rossmann-fold nucleotide-binding protein